MVVKRILVGYLARKRRFKGKFEFKHTTMIQTASPIRQSGMSPAERDLRLDIAAMGQPFTPGKEKGPLDGAAPWKTLWRPQRNAPYPRSVTSELKDSEITVNFTHTRGTKNHWSLTEKIQ